MSEPIMTRRARRPISVIAVATLTWIGASIVALGAPPAQQTFASPEAAADALVAASRADDPAALEKILGPAGRKLVFSGDRVADREGREKFAAAYDAQHALDRESDTTATLVIGTDQWPFPIPLVKRGAAWRFDTAAGAEEILNRRIGRDELNAIKVCEAIAEAEHEYASRDRTGSGLLEFAQKFMSSPGKHDGLYWPTAEGETPSPIGPLVVSARAEGYPAGAKRGQRSPYHGYYYKILKRQGPAAPGGAYEYIVNGHMIGGFALVAFPATYGDSGVMTFIVNQDGVVYQKNLGPRTAKLADALSAFNPDATWTPVR